MLYTTVEEAACTTLLHISTRGQHVCVMWRIPHYDLRFDQVPQLIIAELRFSSALTVWEG
jgi:hypothetical protein